MAVYGLNSLQAGLPATAVICAVCGGAGGLLGSFIKTAAKPDDRSVAEGIVLVTAHVDENKSDIAQTVLRGDAPMAGLVAETA